MVNITQQDTPKDTLSRTIRPVSIIGAGPAGLIAAETLAKNGCAVTVFESNPAPARKFLMAGRGGLNLTHREPFDTFLTRYENAAPFLAPALSAFSPDDLIAWCHGLGIETFVGSSGRVFPKTMKASPLLRAWLTRLKDLGVDIRTSCTWTGWDSALRAPIIKDKTGATFSPDTAAVLLALGGASWPRLSGGGAWTAITDAMQIPRTVFSPANCGFVVPWTDSFAEKFAGSPLKPVVLSFQQKRLQGEVMITAKGLEGGAIYALSAPLRDAIAQDGFAELAIDLRPGLTLDVLCERLATSRGGRSLSTHLAKSIGLSRAAIGLFQERRQRQSLPIETPAQIAALVKALPLRLTATTGIDRAISCAGGLTFNAIDTRYMLRAQPGVFAAGEMLDWEAPTGGYLLQGCFSTGVAAAYGIIDWLKSLPNQQE